MKKNRLLLIIAILIGFIVAFIGVQYFANSSIERVAEKRGALEILEQIETGNSTIVIFDTGNFIKGEEFVKGLTGWSVRTISQATNDRSNDLIFRTDNMSYIHSGPIGFWYGYVNANQVDYIRFQTNGFDIQHRVNAYHWYIPDLSEVEDQGSFMAEQFSVILKDGREIFYPFDELQ
ncbi:MAG: hypothetical protein LPK26_14175 [Bacillaceae bacterium]|nr:hypothetical protein [Bacillaceae bacterium]